VGRTRGRAGGAGREEGEMYSNLILWFKICNSRVEEGGSFKA
jgi:hypothetical protein